MSGDILDAQRLVKIHIGGMKPVLIEGLVPPPPDPDPENSSRDDEEARARLTASAEKTAENLEWLSRYAPARYRELRRRIELLIRLTRARVEEELRG
jgi:hypothetical protein